ncbi:endonuclease/exonuclease/phosphatase family protein [Kribbia dieselivorans]|uniref:endonuclease/exonuclease/phosphatase family protein n=1 Tax=Kribbia dieselivorans TaxID=331526 RepID=UPI0008392136|nr:endonuclease/exonuclease/phosphatase family protein [Kribbia dieselivorans]
MYRLNLRTSASVTVAATGVVALAAVTPAVAAPSDTLPEAAQRTVSVATYNIHHAAGADGVLSLDRIAGVLRDSGAEIIGLQEVDNHWGSRSEFADQAQELADQLSMNVCYSANLDNAPVAGQTHRQQYGTAILSSYKLRNCTNTPLPNHPRGEQRGLAQADINVRGTTFRFFNTHLTHNSTPGRLAQAKVVNDIVTATTTPSVLVGDLNARPDSAEYPVFTSVLSDVWPVVGEGLGYTFDSDDPKGRIDYILTSSDVTPRSAEVIETIASDHMPVVAEVTLPHPGDVHAAR